MDNLWAMLGAFLPRRLAGLLDHDIPLYAAHIPLDVHPEVGNNAVLAERLQSEDGFEVVNL